MRAHAAAAATLLVAGAALVSLGSREQAVPPGEDAPFEVTAYCVKGTTKAGARVREGMAAADPGILPLGSTIELAGSGNWDGIYTVMDTGPAVQGRVIDVYLRDCDEAIELGRRTARVTVIRRGWRPDAIADSAPASPDDNESR